MTTKQIAFAAVILFFLSKKMKRKTAQVAGTRESAAADNAALTDKINSTELIFSNVPRNVNGLLVY